MPTIGRVVIVDPPKEPLIAQPEEAKIALAERVVLGGEGAVILNGLDDAKPIVLANLK